MKFGLPILKMLEEGAVQLETVKVE